MADALSRPPPDDVRDEVSAVVGFTVRCADDFAGFTDADRMVWADPGPWEDVISPGGWHCDVWDVDPVPGGRLQRSPATFPCS